jgi:RNA polymerase sigma-70 factor (ECF subfamily)
MEFFKALYMKYYQRVYGTCFLILKNTALAEEATQDAFLKAYTKIHTLKEPEKFGAWVAAIATKQAINIYNRNKKVFTIDEKEFMEQYLRLNNERLYENDPCSQYLLKEKTEEIRKAILCLTPLLKQMVILKYYWTLTDPEIAQTLKLPLGTVKSSLFRARKLLVKKLTSFNQEFMANNLVKGEPNAEERV